MTKQEFLDALRRTLSGRISAQEVNENIQYYQNYIDGQIRQGKTETEVMTELGDPHILAKTIVQMSSTKEGNGYDENHDRGFWQKQEDSQERSGYDETRDAGFGQSGRGTSIPNIRIPLWVVGLIVLILAVLLFVFLGYLVIVASPFLLLGYLVWLLLRGIGGGRR